MFRTRLHVIGEYRKDEGVYEITMVQRLGGRYDGYCELTAAACEALCAVCNAAFFLPLLSASTAVGLARVLRLAADNAFLPPP